MKKIFAVLTALVLAALVGCGSGSEWMSPEDADRAYDWHENEVLDYVLDEYGVETVLEHIYRAYDDDVVLEYIVGSRALEDIMWEYTARYPKGSADRHILEYIARTYDLDEVADYY